MGVGVSLSVGVVEERVGERAFPAAVHNAMFVASLPYLGTIREALCHAAAQRNHYHALATPKLAHHPPEPRRVSHVGA